MRSLEKKLKMKRSRKKRRRRKTVGKTKILVRRSKNE
jgi:hypothetical protein